MIKNTYKNKMKYELTGTPRVPYQIKGAKGKCNRGNLCESIVKFHRGLDYLSNPNTSGMKGYDIPEEQIEVKSPACGLGRDIGETWFSVSQQISYYFKHAPKGKKWMWVEFDEDTQMVTEYIMNKKEFGAFLHVALRSKQHLQSNKKSINVRFKYSSKNLRNWLEQKVAETA